MVNSKVPMSFVPAGGEVARGHGQFVEIGEKAVQATYFFCGVRQPEAGLIPAIAFCRSSMLFASIT